MTRIQLGDIGTDFVFTIKQTGADGVLAAVDISAAMSMRIEFRRPDGTTFERVATLYASGSDGKLRYVTVSGDIDQAGQWEAQAKLTIGGWSGRSDRHAFAVGANIA